MRIIKTIDDLGRACLCAGAFKYDWTMGWARPDGTDCEDYT